MSDGMMRIANVVLIALFSLAGYWIVSRVLKWLGFE